MSVIPVLWVVGLLAVIAVSLASTANTSYRVARNVLDVALINVTAEAAVIRAVLGLLDRRSDKRWRVDGIAQETEFNAFPMRVSIQDELGRIDLNQADSTILINLFVSAGLDLNSASKLVDKVLDWRTAGDLKRLNGAKDRDYLAAGYTHRPRNGPYQSVDELMLVMDMTPELYRRVAPALTVYSGRPFVDPQVAPIEALLALPTMDAQKAAAHIAARTVPAPSQAAAGAGRLDPELATSGRAFRIRIEVTRQQEVHVRESIVRLTGGPIQIFWPMSWKPE